MKTISPCGEPIAIDEDDNAESTLPPADLIGYAEAARLLNTPVASLYGMVHRRRIPHIRLSKRLVKFSRTTLAAWLAASTVPVADDVRGPL